MTRTEEPETMKGRFAKNPSTNNRPATGPFRVWLLAVRPRTLPASLSPVLVGSALALSEGRFHLPAAISCLAVALLLQIGVNLANDYFDGVRGIDAGERLGPMRVTQSGLIPARRVLAAVFLCMLVAAFPGGYLIFLGGPPIFTLAVASLLATLAYSGGPFPLASHGLGDLFVFLFFGLVGTCGTYYVQAGAFSWTSVCAAVPVGLLITAILVVNNLRDIVSDRKAGKRTLAVILGERNTRVEFVLLLAGAYASPFACLPWCGRGSFWSLLPLLSLPWAWTLIRRIHTTTGRNLNRTLGETARLSLAFGVLFSIGLALSR